MLNKKISALLVTLTVASCNSLSSKNSNKQADSSPAPIKKERENLVKMFSLSEEEIKKSDSGIQVVYFDTNSDKLDETAIATLTNKVLPAAKASTAKKIVIEAHCDERGNNAYNQKLSQKRADSVKKFLVKNNVASAKIKTVAYGKSKPVALGHDEKSWAQNRRAVTIVIKK